MKNKNELRTDSAFSVVPQVVGPAARQLLVPGDGFKRAESGRKCDVSRQQSTPPVFVKHGGKQLHINQHCGPTMGAGAAIILSLLHCLGHLAITTHHHWGGAQLSWKQSGDEVLVWTREICGQSFHSARGYKCRYNLGPLMISLNRFLSGWSDCAASTFNHFRNKFGLILSDPHYDWKQTAPQWVGLGL